MEYMKCPSKDVFAIEVCDLNILYIEVSVAELQSLESRLSREVDECVRALVVGVTKTLLEDQGVQLALLVGSVVEIWLK